jgi:hypothetical protein
VRVVTVSIVLCNSKKRSLVMLEGKKIQGDALPIAAEKLTETETAQATQ